MVAVDLSMGEEELLALVGKPEAKPSTQTAAAVKCPHASSSTAVVPKNPHICTTLFSTWPRMLATTSLVVGAIAAFAYFLVKKYKGKK
jgi:hypothetical protein